jgi:quinol monooxygenase YgiN
MSLLIVARFVPKAGEDARVEAILRGMVPSTRAEPGCRRYDLYRTSTAAGTQFCLIEQYAGEEAIEAHRATPHYKRYRASIADLLAQPIEVARLESIDVQDDSR